MHNMKKFVLFTLLILGTHIANAQVDSTLVQFSGMVLTEEQEQLIPLPFVNVVIKGSNRGTYSNLDGFFTIVGQKGDTVQFSSIGFKQIEYVIPDTLGSNRYSVYQLMTQDTFILPETVIYPWPSREHFRLEFLAMDVESDLQDLADENLAEKALREMVQELPNDGDENADYYLRQQANAQYYQGQIRPLSILNPFAWKRFIDAWKRGDFKSDKDKDKD